MRNARCFPHSDFRHRVRSKVHSNIKTHRAKPVGLFASINIIMPTWLVHQNGIKWSYYRNKLYHATMKSGTSHNEIHVHHSIPLTGSQFDAVERGRAAAFKLKGTGRIKLTIESISTGGKEHLS